MSIWNYNNQLTYSKFLKENFSEESNQERIKYIKGFQERLSTCDRNWARRCGFYPLIKEYNFKSALDVGCGDGTFCCDLVHLFGCEKVYGLDIASVVLNMVKNIDNQIIYFDGEAKALPLDDNSVEFVTAFDVLEHILPQDVEKTIQEFDRVSTKGLMLSISHRLSGEIVDGSNLHMCVKPFKWWKEKLSRYFEVELLVGMPELGASGGDSKIICLKN